MYLVLLVCLWMMKFGVIFVLRFLQRNGMAVSSKFDPRKRKTKLKRVSSSFSCAVRCDFAQKRNVKQVRFGFRRSIRVGLMFVLFDVWRWVGSE